MSDSDEGPSRKRSHSPEIPGPIDTGDVALFMPIVAKRGKLSAGSHYFGAMFKSSVFTEHDQAEINMQPPPGLDPNACNHVLLYMSGYFSSLTIPDGQAEQILQVAEYFQLPDLKEIGRRCADKLASETNAANCLRHLKVALRFEHEWLTKKAWKKIVYGFGGICGREDFLDCSMNELLYILRQDFLVVPSEEQIVEAVMAWFAHDKPSRWKPDVFSAVLSEIRWSLLGDGARMMLMSSEDPFRTALIDILQYSGLSSQQNIPTTRPVARQRNLQDVIFTYCPTPIGFALTCVDQNLTSWPIAPYDTHAISLDGFVTPSQWAVKVSNKIVFQIRHLGRCSTVAYDPAKHAYETLSGHEKLNLGFTADKEIVSTQPVVIGHKIYIFKDGKRSQELFEYNFKSKALHRKTLSSSGRSALHFFLCFESVKQLRCLRVSINICDPTARIAEILILTHVCAVGRTTPKANCGIEVYRDELILIGGQLLPLKPRIMTNSVDRFSPITNQWTPLPPMPDRTAHCAAKVFQDHLYVTGGTILINRRTIEIAECWRLNLITPTVWHQIGSLGWPRRDHGMLVASGMVYVVGGISERFMHSMERYEKYVPRINHWYGVFQFGENRVGRVKNERISVMEMVSTVFRSEKDKDDE